MQVDNMPTAHTYFTAAINMGYNTMMIDDCEEEINNQIPLKIYATRVAKQNFDTTTGDILPCCDNTLCKAYAQIWFFCNGIGLVQNNDKYSYKLLNTHVPEIYLNINNV